MLDLCLYCKKEYKKREAKRKFCSISCSNRHNLNGINNVSLPTRSQALAEFIGICLGDGTTGLYQTGITLNKNADKEYIPYVHTLAKNLFPGAGVSLVKRKDNAIDIRITSKMVVQFLRENGIVAHAKYIPTWIKNNADFSYACIRGLIDTEGSTSQKTYISRAGVRKYYQLNFRNTNTEIMLFVRDNLTQLKLSPTQSLANSLYLSNPTSIALFKRVIGFSNPKLVKKLIAIT